MSGECAEWGRTSQQRIVMCLSQLSINVVERCSGLDTSLKGRTPLLIDTNKGFSLKQETKLGNENTS